MTYVTRNFITLIVFALLFFYAAAVQYTLSAFLGLLFFLLAEKVYTIYETKKEQERLIKQAWERGMRFERLAKIKKKASSPDTI